MSAASPVRNAKRPRPAAVEEMFLALEPAPAPAPAPVPERIINLHRLSNAWIELAMRERSMAAELDRQQHAYAEAARDDDKLIDWVLARGVDALQMLQDKIKERQNVVRSLVETIDERNAEIERLTAELARRDNESK